jgi:hypothetical protein
VSSKDDGLSVRQLLWLQPAGSQPRRHAGTGPRRGCSCAPPRWVPAAAIPHTSSSHPLTRLKAGCTRYGDAR